MDFIVNIIIELFQPIGNLFAKKALPKGMVEENSTMSVFLGGLIVIAALIILGFLLIKFVG
jgi:hypothetical protein